MRGLIAYSRLSSFRLSIDVTITVWFFSQSLLRISDLFRFGYQFLRWNKDGKQRKGKRKRKANLFFIYILYSKNCDAYNIRRAGRTWKFNLSFPQITRTEFKDILSIPECRVSTDPSALWRGTLYAADGGRGIRTRASGKGKILIRSSGTGHREIGEKPVGCDGISDERKRCPRSVG